MYNMNRLYVCNIYKLYKSIKSVDTFAYLFLLLMWLLNNSKLDISSRYIPTGQHRPREYIKEKKIRL